MRKFTARLTVNSLFLKTKIALFLLVFTSVSLHSPVDEDYYDYFQNEAFISSKHVFTSSKKNIPFESELDDQDKFLKKAVGQRSGDTQFRIDLFIAPYSESLNTKLGNTVFTQPNDEYFLAFIISGDDLSRAPPIVL